MGLTSQSTSWGRAQTPSLVATLSTLILSNIRLLPASHTINTGITRYIVPLSVLLILLGADLRRVIALAGRLFPVFVARSISRCVGSLVAWSIVPFKAQLGLEAAWKIADSLTPRYIGSAVNYVVVADATWAPPDVVAAALTADNVVVAPYFVIFLLPAHNVAQASVKPTAVTNFEIRTTTNTSGNDCDKSTDDDNDSEESG